MVMPVTIPSGIITTSFSALENIANNIPEVGILTTKSIGPEARTGNREPIFAQYSPGSFVNAVGLTNPGAEEFARQLSEISIPDDKFLLVSIFGKNKEEFVYVAKTLEPFVNGLELNLSCPHVKGHGMALGQDEGIVYEITNAVTGITRKPVFAKLTPNTNKIGKMAKAALTGGASGIVLINTFDPLEYCVDSHPVLSNGKGGRSGKGIREIGLQKVKETREAIGEKPFILGMGGIRTARDVIDYMDGGANAVGIGSGLIGMDDETLGFYFPSLFRDIENNGRTNFASSFLQEVDMSYKKVKVVNNPKQAACNLKSIVTDYSIDAGAGQFVYAWIPGVGEKPFSIMDDNPLTLGILERGPFTEKINSLEKGAEFYIRGPHGKSVESIVPNGSDVVLVGGGCGVAGISLIAKKLSKNHNVTSILGVKKAEDLLDLEKLKEYGSVYVATEDGSLGAKGFVSPIIQYGNFVSGSYFFNCGPRAMIDAVLPLELEISSPENIYSSRDPMTKCGVGICGSCADDKGKRTCVEGPFMMAD